MAKRQTLEPRSFQIACMGGSQSVQGRVIGDFGVHAANAMWNYWSVTHLPTGWAVRTGLTKRRAEQLARECHTSGMNWRIKNPARPPVKLKRWAKDMATRYPNYL